MRYLLDTDTCINIIRSKDDALIRRVTAAEIENLSISTITIAELEFGAAKSTCPEQNTLALSRFLAPFRILAFDTKAAYLYGIARVRLQSLGQIIGPYDLLIAAHALADDLTLVTNNIKEFKRVDGLRLESWIELQGSK